eukprot:TRINITY_DN1317_c0_g2_i1.p1 TRINITY_DN1317_c0_g2~~TRINITY_DN1317_c0_g2_i1.p1  ORF type:complete len:169 (+),score=33.98 TRINITY_DN1317_c0_g2_i1:265-771(+)
MSRARKHVAQQIQSLDAPIINENQKIAKITGLRGNICEVEFHNGEKVLSSLPSRFKGLVGFLKGNYVVVDVIPDRKEASGKVVADVSAILTPAHIDDLKTKGIWPKEFEEIAIPTKIEEKTKPVKIVKNENSEGEEEESEDDLSEFINPNHRYVADEDDDEEEEEEET